MYWRCVVLFCFDWLTDLFSFGLKFFFSSQIEFERYILIGRSHYTLSVSWSEVSPRPPWHGVGGDSTGRWGSEVETVGGRPRKTGFHTALDTLSYFTFCSQHYFLESIPCLPLENFLILFDRWCSTQGCTIVYSVTLLCFRLLALDYCSYFTTTKNGFAAFWRSEWDYHFLITEI